MNLRLLPILVLVAFLSFAVRLGEFVMDVRSLSGSAQAQEQDAPEPPARAEAADMESVETPPQDRTWRDSSDTDLDHTHVQMELLEDLSARRQDLDRRAQDLSVREALLQAAEKELEQKIAELSDLREEIQALLQQQSEEEDARITSLVRIYEGMRAKDAARIFNTLDLDVLLAVVGRMSERRSAPIIAEMDPERARTLTIMLAERNQLPTLPEN